MCNAGTARTPARHPADLLNHPANYACALGVAPIGKRELKIEHPRFAQWRPKQVGRRRKRGSEKARGAPRENSQRFQSYPRRRKFQPFLHRVPLSATVVKRASARWRNVAHDASESRPANVKLAGLDNCHYRTCRRKNEADDSGSFRGCGHWHLSFRSAWRTGVGRSGQPRYAWIARAMSETGDWITPRLYGAPWFEKPVLYYWLAGLGLSWALAGVGGASPVGFRGARCDDCNRLTGAQILFPRG